MRTSMLTVLSLTAAASGQLCAPWEVIPTPPGPDATQSVIRDLAVPGPDDVWAVGSFVTGTGASTRIRQMSLHWDGDAWTFVDVPVFMEGAGYLWAVAAAGPDTIWAAGDGQRVAPDGFPGTHMLVLRWNGAGWQRFNTPIVSGTSGDLIRDIEIVAPDQIWFVGEAQPVPASSQPSLAMLWDGSTFRIVPTPIVNPRVIGFGNGNGLRAIDAVAPDDIWAVGAAGDGDSIIDASQILHWNGSEWQHRPGPIPGAFHDLNAVVAVSADDVWAGGEYFDGTSYHGLALHWDGAAWSQVPVPGSINDFVANGPDDIYAAGSGIMHWDGVSWSVVESFPAVFGAALTSLDGAGQCRLWTGGRRIVGDSVFNFTARVPGRDACPADLTGDGLIDFSDYLSFLNFYETGDLRADFIPDGMVDFSDYLEFLNHYDAGC